MKTIITLIAFFPISLMAFEGLSAKEQAEFDKKMVVANNSQAKKEGLNDVMIISPESRAKDFKAAYDIMRQSTQSSKITFLLTDKSKISGIIDIQVLPGGTMLSFTLNTTKGIKYKIIPIEQIKSIEK